MSGSSTNRREHVFNVVVASIVLIFMVMWIVSVRGPTLISNDKCFAVLGCNVGFFGYDALLHFVSGIMDAVVIVWLARKFPSISLFHQRFWKNFLIVIALVALIAVSWEFGEYCHDQFRMNVLHENLTMPNHLDQPSNADTMGDLTFSILGSALTALALQSMLSEL